MLAAQKHDVQWLAAAPLWDTTAPHAGTMRPPALLRFGNDRFMEDLQERLSTTPRKPRPDLAPLVARWESFREDPPANPGPAPDIKLYQPIHGHFYLVAASLVCRLPGLPDHGLDVARGDRVGFVLRRLSGDGELAWVPAPADPMARRWKAVTHPSLHHPDEELFPMFPSVYDDAGKTRRLHTGLVPTSAREAFEKADVEGETDAVPAAFRYVIRCVYTRPACGPLHPDVVGDASVPFTLAQVFDVDAPARTLRIPMPTDPASFKSFKKGVGIILSKEMGKKLSVIGPLKDIIDGNTKPEQNVSLGEICTLSIPVITLCAMIVLYIFIALLNIVFFWSAFIKICIPYPKAR